MNTMEPEKFVVLLKDFLKEQMDHDAYLIIDPIDKPNDPNDPNDFNFLIMSSVVALIAETMKRCDIDISLLNPAEVYVCEIFVVIAAQYIIYNLGLPANKSNAILSAYYAVFINRFDEEGVKQQCKKGVSSVNLFHEQHPKTRNGIMMAIAGCIEKPSNERMWDLSDAFQLIVANTTEIETHDGMTTMSYKKTIEIYSLNFDRVVAKPT